MKIHVAGRLPAALLGLSLLTAGCASISGTLPSAPPRTGSGRLRAGAAEVDITPLPGFPLGGHGPMGRISRGYWTRLYARAICLEGDDGRRLALVAADLWAVPAGLGDRVAELLGENGQPPIAREELVLAATHTHQSPAGFATASVYNDWASSRRGFDERLFGMLATRIADSVAKACGGLSEATISFGAAQLGGLSRNRSLEPFLLNPESGRILTENRAAGPQCRELAGVDPEACNAVDRTLRVLRLDAVGGEPIAVAAFFAVHPTAMSNTSEVYSADLFGVAVREARRLLRAGSGGRAPVVALFNGAEGDVSPDWAQQDVHEVLRLGRKLGGAVAELAGTDLGRLSGGGLTGRYGLLPLQGWKLAPDGKSCERPLEAAQCERDDDITCLSRRPIPGVAVLGGADDGRQPFYELGFREGVMAAQRGIAGGQGSKQPALNVPGLTPWNRLTEWTFSAQNGPFAAPLAVYRIGEGSQAVVLLTLPGELTTVMGRRVREAALQALEVAPLDVVSIGLANEYLSYFATPEEYDLQHYEGASTVFGPYAGPTLAASLARLTRCAGEPSELEKRDFHYTPGMAEQFTVSDATSEVATMRDGLKGFLTDERGAYRPDVVSYCWLDDGPLRTPAAVRSSTRLLPRVHVERKTEAGLFEPAVFAGEPETDEGVHLVTAVVGAEHERPRWCTFWIRPAAARAGEHRICVETVQGARSCSQPITAATVP